MAARSPYRPRHRLKPASGLFDRILDPIDRLSETIFSILILLTFTLAFRIIRLSGDPGQAFSIENMNDLLVGAVGAILAWGMIDGVMYALFSLFERGEKHRLLKEIQIAETDQDAVDVIADELDFILEPIADEGLRQKLYFGVLDHLRDSKPRRIEFTRDDFTGALGHVIVAMIAVLPSLVPLLLLRQNPDLAIRLSNIVSFIVLFSAGYRWGIYTGANPWKTGLLLMAVAVVIVLIAILLGG